VVLVVLESFPPAPVEALDGVRPEGLKKRRPGSRPAWQVPSLTEGSRHGRDVTGDFEEGSREDPRTRLRVHSL